jgi:hypothetical protein
MIFFIVIDCLSRRRPSFLVPVKFENLQLGAAMIGDILRMETQVIGIVETDDGIVSHPVPVVISGH